MSLILSGTDGLSDVDGTAATPAIRGTDANTGIFFGTDIIGFSEGGVEAARINADSQFVAAAGTAALPVITTTGDLNTGIFFPAADTIAFSEGGAEAMRIDSSGNVGIGTSPAYKLDVLVASNKNIVAFTPTSSSGISDFSAGGVGWGFSRPSSGLVNSVYSYDTAASAKNNFVIQGRSDIVFTNGGDYTSAVECLRIDTSGNLLLGTTSATSSSRLRVKSSDNTDNTYTIYVDNSSATQLFSVISDGDFSTGQATHSPYNYTTANAANMVVESSGLVKRSTSSLKYKKNIADATHGLTDVLKLRSVTYEGKAEGDAGKTFGGLIAEEVHDAGLTEFVQYAEDGTPDALAYGNMVSLCVKAIQEQQAIIQSLTARITALETA